MLHFRSLYHEPPDMTHVERTGLRPDEIRHLIDDRTVILPAQKPLGGHFVVVHEVRIGKPAADGLEKCESFTVGEAFPGGHGDLEEAETPFIGIGQSVDDLGHRKADNAHHRVESRFQRRVGKDVHNVPILCFVHSVSFAHGAHYVHSCIAGVNRLIDDEAEHLFVQGVVIFPGCVTGPENT